MIKFIIDHREKRSGIPALLKNSNTEIIFKNMLAGDYLINDIILVERKTADDFIQSLIVNRLFEQCVKLKKNGERQLILVEGNPYTTNHQMDEQAIRGALLSVLSAWQIPVIFSANKENTAGILLMLGKQNMNNKVFLRKKTGYRSKNKLIRQSQFLQGLPSTGPVLATKMIEHFGNIRSVITATTEELMKIEGIAKKRAEKIVEFIAIRNK